MKLMSVSAFFSKIISVSLRMQMTAAVLLGGLHAFSLSGITTPYLNGLLQCLAVMGLAILIAQSRSVWRAAFIGWLFALVWLTGCVWWLYISMHQYGGMPAIMAAVAVVLLCGGLAIIYGVAMGLVRQVSPAQNISVLVFAAAWLLAEVIRGWIFTGFPWAASGYAHIDNDLAAYAPWVGVYGVGAISALTAACVAVICFLKECSKRQRIAVIAVAVVAFGMPEVLPRNFTQPAGDIKVALLQGNVPQNLKFDPVEMQVAINWYIRELELAKLQGVDLVVTPETAIPVFMHYLPATMQNRLREDFATGSTAAMIGIPTMDGHGRYANSLIALAPGQEVYQYDKYHLVPFGEFVPWGFKWFVNMMNIPLGDFNRGAVDAPSFAWQGQRFAPHICYEDLFGEELVHRFGMPGQEPTIMVNISNIAWFGNTVAVPQHLQIARMRALELQRPVIRATNTGATAIINHRGKVLQMLAPFTQDVLIGDVQGRSGLTPYARWAGRFGLLPLWVLAIGIIVFSGLRTRLGI